VHAPEGAATFMLHKHWTDENGAERRTKIKGEPGKDGVVPDQWPARDFTPEKILEVFGPAKYRADFYDAGGTHIKGTGFVFEVAAPVRVPRARKGGASVDDEDDPDEEYSSRRGPSSSVLERLARQTQGGGAPQISILDVIMLQAESRREADAQAQLAIARERQDSLDRQQRDREFMATMITMMGQRGAGPDMDQIRRELELAQRETRLVLRGEVRQVLGAVQAAPPDDDGDDGDGPASIEEAIEEAGATVLGDLTKRAPQLVGELFTWLQKRGYQPGPEAQAALGAAFGPPGAQPPAGPVNGAPRV
jgi:hypothetical protein